MVFILRYPQFLKVFCFVHSVSNTVLVQTHLQYHYATLETGLLTEMGLSFLTMVERIDQRNVSTHLENRITSGTIGLVHPASQTNYSDLLL